MFLQTKFENKFCSKQTISRIPLSNRKAQVLVNDSAAHQKKRQSLSPENKTQMLCNNAAAQKKHQESLPPDDKVQILMNHAAAHKSNKSLSLLMTKFEF